jgi:hypothetical protein
MTKQFFVESFSGAGAFCILLRRGGLMESILVILSTPQLRPAMRGFDATGWNVLLAAAYFAVNPSPALWHAARITPR